MINIHVVPCLEDNYAYLVENTLSGNTILIDVPDAPPILETVEQKKLRPKYVMFTHHHWDHIDGFPHLHLPNMTVIGTTTDAHRLPKLDLALEPDHLVEIDGIRIEVIPANGHTIGQVAYYLPEYKVLFSADSLMTWGCGRLMEGTYAQAFDTLERLSRLPADTMVYSGHNYGEMGGKFAISLGGDLDLMNARMVKVQSQNAKGEPIVPVALADELVTNPFLKCHDDNYARQLGIESLSPIERFTHIRELRNKF